ncbi:hypothetical protein MANES_13G003702v8 [Manihot esculenta]|uniref:Uncharacterized protein n=1 Tax=Manihot esculenta TaxID=3983 RepID=A0ACB7GJR7_MANES|nr:hypothetical protein MANES_13G003702v8 [Manihot esculenta]
MTMTPRSIFTRTWRSFHFQLQIEIGTLYYPILLFKYSFHSSNSTRSRKDARLRSKFYSASFPDLDDALSSFNHIILMHPLPSIVQFVRFLSALVRMKQYHTVLSSSRKTDSLGISRSVNSLNILINCYCRLHRVDFGFSVLGKSLKLGLEPDIVTFTTLIDGMCKDSTINRQ